MTQAAAARRATWRDYFVLTKPKVIVLLLMTTVGAMFIAAGGFPGWVALIGTIVGGYMYSEFMGKLHFWLAFIGANVIFFPQHFLGLSGMPRRIADYPDAFSGWNFISSLGSYLFALGLLVFFFCIYRAFAAKVKAGANPWGPGATTLEWTLPSPPPFHQFEVLPRIK